MNYDWQKLENRVFRGTKDDDLIQLYDSHQVTVCAGEGDDTVDMNGGCHRSVVFGEDGDDLIMFTAWNDWSGSSNVSISGGTGNDTITLQSGLSLYNHYAQGDDGDDIIDIHGLLDTIIGGAGNDAMAGNAGNDLIYQ